MRPAAVLANVIVLPVLLRPLRRRIVVLSVHRSIFPAADVAFRFLRAVGRTAGAGRLIQVRPAAVLANVIVLPVLLRPLRRRIVVLSVHRSIFPAADGALRLLHAGGRAAGVVAGIAARRARAVLPDVLLHLHRDAAAIIVFPVGLGGLHPAPGAGVVVGIHRAVKLKAPLALRSVSAGSIASVTGADVHQVAVPTFPPVPVALYLEASAPEVPRLTHGEHLRTRFSALAGVEIQRRAVALGPIVFILPLHFLLVIPMPVIAILAIVALPQGAVGRLTVVPVVFVVRSPVILVPLVGVRLPGEVRHGPCIPVLYHRLHDNGFAAKVRVKIAVGLFAKDLHDHILRHISRTPDPDLGRAAAALRAVSQFSVIVQLARPFIPYRTGNIHIRSHGGVGIGNAQRICVFLLRSVDLQLQGIAFHGVFQRAHRPSRLHQSAAHRGSRLAVFICAGDEHHILQRHRCRRTGPVVYVHIVEIRVCPWLQNAAAP